MEDHAELTPEFIRQRNVEFSLYANGSIRSAQVEDRRILSLLLTRGLLEDDASSSAATYEDWRNAFRGERGSHEAFGAPAEFGKEDCFSRLIRAVPYVILTKIEESLFESPPEHLTAKARRNPQPFIDAYDRLGRAILAIRKEAAAFNRQK